MNVAVPAEPLPFRSLVDEAMKLTRRHIGSIYLPLAIPLAVLAAVQVIVQLRFSSALVEAGASPTSPVFLTAGCVAGLVTILLFVAIRGLASAVATACAVDAASGRPPAVGQKWGFVFQPSTLATLLLSLVAIVVGFVFLVLPGIYISLRLAFLIPVMAAEGLRGGAAMKRSWTLVRYNPQKRFLDNTGTKIFLLFLIAGVIGYAVGVLVQLPFTAIQGFRVARTISSGRAALMTPDYWVQIPSSVLASLVSTAITIYTSFGIVLLYNDVVRRKEGSDLAAAIEARFGPPSAGTAPA